MENIKGRWAGNVACKGNLIDAYKNLLLKICTKELFVRKDREFAGTIILVL